MLKINFLSVRATNILIRNDALDHFGNLCVLVTDAGEKGIFQAGYKTTAELIVYYAYQFLSNTGSFNNSGKCYKEKMLSNYARQIYRRNILSAKRYYDNESKMVNYIDYVVANWFE